MSSPLAGDIQDSSLVAGSLQTTEVPRAPRWGSARHGAAVAKVAPSPAAGARPQTRVSVIRLSEGWR